MINGEPEDELRRLVIAFYPADGEMAAFEAWTPRIRMSFHPNGPTQVSPKQQGRVMPWRQKRKGIVVWVWVAALNSGSYTQQRPHGGQILREEALEKSRHGHLGCGALFP